MYANIVVAVDGSEAAKRALSEAVQLAKLSRGKLTAVYVLDQSAAFTYAGACDPHLLTDAARQVGDESVRWRAHPDARVQCRGRHGDRGDARHRRGHRQRLMRCVQRLARIWS